jgi:hypothetical protein
VTDHTSRGTSAQTVQINSRPSEAYQSRWHGTRTPSPDPEDIEVDEYGQEEMPYIVGASGSLLSVAYTESYERGRWTEVD